MCGNPRSVRCWNCERIRAVVVYAFTACLGIITHLRCPSIGRILSRMSTPHFMEDTNLYHAVALTVPLPLCFVPPTDIPAAPAGDGERAHRSLASSPAADAHGADVDLGYHPALPRQACPRKGLEVYNTAHSTQQTSSSSHRSCKHGALVMSPRLCTRARTPECVGIGPFFSINPSLYISVHTKQ